jgi:hypothetical protein
MVYLAITSAKFTLFSMQRLLRRSFLFGLLIAILVTHIFATYYHWYWTIWWLDIPMHLAGGFLIGMLTLLYVERHRVEHFSRLIFLEKFFLVLGVAALIGIFWEFYEFFMDVFFLKHQLALYLTQLGAVDTMKDLADDLMGALLAFLVAAKF